MGSQILSHEQTKGNGRVRVNGSFSLGGSPAKVAGTGWTVAKSATGKFRVTLEDKYQTLISCMCTIVQTSGAPDADNVVRPIVWTQSNGYVEFWAYDKDLADSGVLDDLASTDQVHFEIVFARSAHND